MYKEVWHNPLIGKDCKQPKCPLTRLIMIQPYNDMHIAIKRNEVAISAGEKFSKIY